jgi:Rrf2 family iron-sulfur cluster assembly transcriptional regulator
MKLSAKGRYAIKALVNIATNDSKTPKTLLEISKYQGISLSYLEQLFSLLRKHNLVSGVRGPGGGYTLKDNPDNITIASIIKAINQNTLAKLTMTRLMMLFGKNLAISLQITSIQSL